MRKYLLLFLFMICSFTALNVRAEISVDAASAILMEKVTKRVLYEKNMNTRYLTASIAKIMTAIVAIENGNLDEYYQVDEETTHQTGSSVYLQLGEEIKLRDLIYGLLLRSGNDAAYLIANSVGKDYDDFIFLMNETAKKIGMKSSSFSNPSGLDEKSANYSSAYDMALLMAYALGNEEFQKITKTKTYRGHTKSGAILYYTNKHRLIQTKDYVTGGKTGYTTIAKRTLVTSANKNNMELIVVTFNCGDDWNVHQKLFEYGYNNYQMHLVIKSQIIKVNDYLYPATPMIVHDIKYPVRNDEKVDFVIQLLKHPLTNKVIGKVKIYIDGKGVYSVDIYRYY